MTRTQHGVRIGLLMALVAGLLGWLSSHTEILFADGLRYIAQAQRLESGSWREGLLGAVDHPLYPIAIAASHHYLTKGGDGPDAWQSAAQTASVLSGVFLVIPLYLVCLELFGARAAWVGVCLVYSAPLTSHILADVLSEGTFLLFWTWGLWAALRFLREGTFGWLPLTIICGGLSYLTRPEGFLLPAALVVTLALMPLLRSTRLNWPRWWAAVGFLVIGPALVVGPYVAVKGGLGTKPAIARLLGTAPKSAADAVERSRPLDPNQSTAKTYALAAKAVWESIRDSVSLPLIPLAILGLAFTCWPLADRARVWLFLGIIGVAGVVALIRLHATGGYCTPRHAILLAFLLIPSAAAGLDRLLGSVSIPGRWLGLGEGRFTAGPAVWAVILGGFAAWSAPKVLEPINEKYVGYRLAGAWISEHVPANAHVVDTTGWSLYYGRRSGYTFANLHEALSDSNLRWVVVRDAHLRGPWWYCRVVQELVGHRDPIMVFPAHAAKGQARVFVFDRQVPGSPSLTQKAVTRR